jgi:hypothetical protein
MGVVGKQVVLINVRFVDAIEKTSVGNINNVALREQSFPEIMAVLLESGYKVRLSRRNSEQEVGRKNTPQIIRFEGLIII